MPCKSIEIMGNYISLENVSYVSAVRKSDGGQPEFQMSYINSIRPIIFYKTEKEYNKMLDLGEGAVVVWSKIPLEELRYKIVKIVNK